MVIFPEMPEDRECTDGGCGPDHRWLRNSLEAKIVHGETTTNRQSLNSDAGNFGLRIEEAKLLIVEFV